MSKIPLPETAQVIADVIGRSSTLALASICQHRHLYVPKGKLPPDHAIVRCIGLIRTEQLQKAFGGEQLPLAACYSIFAAERNIKIRIAAAAGQTVKEIAAEYNLHPRHVLRLLPKDDPYGVEALKNSRALAGKNARATGAAEAQGEAKEETLKTQQGGGVVGTSEGGVVRVGGDSQEVPRGKGENRSALRKG